MAPPPAQLSGTSLDYTPGRSRRHGRRQRCNRDTTSRDRQSGRPPACGGVAHSAIRARFLAHLPAGARVLDLGCGSGRDARAFLDAGYAVTAVDGAPAMAKLASGLLGQPVRVVRFEDLDFEAEFEGVWACASLLHFARADLPAVLARIACSLQPGGVFYCSFKLGDTERIRGERLCSTT